MDYSLNPHGKNIKIHANFSISLPNCFQTVMLPNPKQYLWDRGLHSGPKMLLHNSGEKLSPGERRHSRQFATHLLFLGPGKWQVWSSHSAQKESIEQELAKRPTGKTATRVSARLAGEGEQSESDPPSSQAE